MLGIRQSQAGVLETTSLEGYPVDVVLLYAVIFAFVIAFVFSMFGQGGGSVYSPLLILLGYAVLVSTSTSLFLNLITSLSAGYIFYRNKLIDIKASLLFVPGIGFGAFVGGALSAFVEGVYVMWLFVVFLGVIGARMIYTYWERGTTEGAYPEVLPTKMKVLVILFSFAVGFISGLLGVGGGVFIVPFMVYVCKYPTKFAAGSSHLIISFSAFFGIVGHAAFHSLDLLLIAATGMAVLVGGNLGARASMKMKVQGIKAGLGLIMWILAVMLLVQII
ncbi:MAG: sulfite exporter TauE/SafE family protein [Candidatus Thorarchaeota archaeon]|nr:sulfite exporter TauE/SafE family protein [Candidatus Thorarchaeota archaeon]